MTGVQTCALPICDLVHAPDGRTAASTYDDLVETDPETVCQWTGLADKDGRKIFEGDICKIHSGPIDEEDGCFSVEWDEGDARFALYGEGLTVDFGNYHGHECEVIGNIFDNPDLLPEEDT